jgi:L-rhamnose mutarotase
MKLKEGCAAEYRRRHEQIWPELMNKYSDYGIRDYTIFLDEKTLTLFAVRQVPDDYRGERLSADELIRQWWDYNAGLMECNADNSPISQTLEEVFHVD